jgi:DNA segregation ATPase FtsK/SpoIIIE, S-DNA-T family
MSQIELADTNLPPESSPNEREAARSALRDLLKHASDCAAAEQRIEQRHIQQVTADAKALEKATFETQQRAKSHREQVEQKYREHVAQMQARHDADMKALKEHDHEVRRHALNQREKVDRDVKKEFDNAAWLAESVYDGEVQAMEKEAKEYKEKLVGEGEELDRIEARAAELMHIYGQEKNRVSASEQDKHLIKADADAAFTQFRADVDKRLHTLEFQPIARMFVGILPLVIVVVLSTAAAAGAYFTSPNPNAPDLTRVAIWGGSTLAALIVLGVALKILANRQVRAAYAPLSQALDAARWAEKARLENFERKQAKRHDAALEVKNQETQAARDKYTPFLQRAKEQFDQTISALQADFQKKRDEIRDRLRAQIAEADAWLKRHIAELDQKAAHDLAAAEQGFAAAKAAEEQKYAAEKAELLQTWQTGLKRLSNPIQSGPGQTAAPLAWNDPAWGTWEPSKAFAEHVRFGELQVDVKQVIESLPKDKPFGLPLPEAFQLPAVLSFPAHGSLMIHTDRIGRAAGLETLQMVMTRLLTTLPPGRVKFTIIDPVGLGQNFAGFMHLADYDESLVSSRIWTDAEQIEKRLTDLTEHMETVIQKYLRNEFATIDEYNAQAGELAEPYRYLVIADFPVGFQGDIFRRLASIATSGPRCGVYLLILRDTRQTIPSGSHVDEVEAHCVNLVQNGTKFTWRDDVFRQFPLTLDPAPAEDDLTKIMHIVGRGARNANRVEVPFETIAPDNGEFWSMSSRDELRVPIGRMGATRLQQLKLGKGVAQHSLIAGKTGSGKSTLLHAMITNLAMWYSPEEVEFYLIDFKKGVEFKTYGTYALPHARAIAVESDREFGLSVLQRLDAELARRGEIFRKASVQDLPSYRQTSGAQIMPRTLLMIDEFQEFFSEDDKLAQEAGLLLDRLVRQGRAFGMHVLLGSQTIAGSAGLARSTIGQMAVRIALQCSEADSQLILGDNNSAARLLSRPGEAIYNDAGGLVEGNSPFQIAWLPDEQRERYLIKVKEAAQKKGVNLPLPIVFEGNAPAHVETNHQLDQMFAQTTVRTPMAPLAFLGDPVAIKNPTAIPMRRQSGSNVLIVGQQDESALAMLQMAIISLAAQYPKERAKFIVLDGTPADSPFAGSFRRIKDAVPHEVNLVEWRMTADVINETAREMQRRIDEDDPNAPAIFVVIYGLQRYRILRKGEDDFSFGLSNPDDPPKPPNTGKQFTELLKDGPAVGIHVMAWADTPVAVERTLDRGSMREFDHRVLFQMSANDSSNLIDSPAANKLGFYRALAFSEEQGVMEKFRPYAVPSDQWLQHVRQELAKRG